MAETHDFDRPYWEEHWRKAHRRAADPNPHLAREVGGLAPGTALDAGCGEGAEAAWLADRGWDVTAADISAAALARAAERSAHVRWVHADLTVWTPDTPFDLVMTHYAHPSTPQLAFYERISGWVAPGGTLLVVGHLHHHPEEVSVTPRAVTAVLDTAEWVVVTAEERVRALPSHGAELHDVVVRATRRPEGRS